MSINNFDLNLLKTFVAVAEAGGFTKGARKLNIEQPSVTRAIQRLESEVGPLFLRTKRRVQLTTKGADLLVAAKNILLAGNEFLIRAKDKELELSGTVKFAAETPISSLFMPDVINQISKEYPRLWPMMYTGITDDVIKRIKDGELEFGLFFYEGNRIGGLEYKELVQCEFLIAAAPNLNREGLNSFIGSREINESGIPSLPVLNRLKKLNKSIRIKYSANDLTAYRELVLRGLGIGLFPKPLIHSDIQQRRLKVLYPSLKLSFPVWLVSRQGVPLSLEASRMIGLSVEVIKTASSVRAGEGVSRRIIKLSR